MFCSVCSWVWFLSCRDIRCSMGGNGIIALVRALVSLGIIVFLLFSILANAATSVPSTEKVKSLRFSGKDVNLFHVSKRKVPNGADPIHNRKAETSRRPPRV
ncbi:CLAVATA3/ESR [Hirschfeldia incana]|nr:CLAVATA3/ESR [Hirschfeldia incana]